MANLTLSASWGKGSPAVVALAKSGHMFWKAGTERSRSGKRNSLQVGLDFIITTRMHQKGFINVVLLLIIVVIVGAIVYFTIQQELTPKAGISLKGMLVPGGVECRLFRADNGVVYSLQASGKMFESFQDRDLVSVQGELIQKSYCMQGYEVIQVTDVKKD